MKRTCLVALIAMLFSLSSHATSWIKAKSFSGFTEDGNNIPFCAYVMEGNRLLVKLNLRGTADFVMDMNSQNSVIDGRNFKAYESRTKVGLNILKKRVELNFDSRGLFSITGLVEQRVFTSNQTVSSFVCDF